MKEKTFWIAVTAAIFAALFIFRLSRKKPETLQADRAPVAEESRPETPQAPAKPAAEAPVPIPINPAQEYWKNDLLDLAAISNDETNETIRHYFRLFKERSEIESAFITVPSLNGEKIQSLAERIFSKWDLPNGKDKGLLFLITSKEGQAVLWLGKDLRSLLSEKDIEDVLRLEFYPAYEKGNTLGAVWSTMAAIHNLLYERKSHPLSDTAGIVFISLFIGLFIAIGFAAVGYGLGSGQISLMIWGTFFGGLPFLFTSLGFLKSGLAVPFLFHASLAIGMATLGRRWGIKKRRN